MSVAALSTASSILSTLPATPAATPNSGAVNDAEPFAKLIGKPKKEGKSPDGEGKTVLSVEAEPEAITDDAAGPPASAIAEAEDESEDDGKKGETSLLADMEAMLAAANKIAVVPPVAAMPAIAPTTKADPSPAIPVTAPVATTPTLTPAMPTASATGEAPIASHDPSMTADHEMPLTSPPDATASTNEATTPVSPDSNLTTLLAALKSSAARQAATPASPPAEAKVEQARSGSPAKSGSTVANISAPIASTKVAPLAPGEDASDARIPQSAKTAPPVSEATTPHGVAIATAPEAGGSDTTSPDKAVAPPASDAGNGDDAPAPIVTSTKAAGAEAPVNATLRPAPATNTSLRAPTRDEMAPTPGSTRKTTLPGNDPQTDVQIAAISPAPVTAAQGSTPADSATATLASQSVDRHIDLARDTQWLDKLAKDITQAAATQSHLRIHLNPEHLGALQIEISNSAAGATIRMTADNDEARTIIADAQPRLLAEVRAQGLRVADAQVDLGNQQQSRGGNAQMAGGQMADGQQRRSSEDHKPFSATPANQRELPRDSEARDGELYA